MLLGAQKCESIVPVNANENLNVVRMLQPSIEQIAKFSTSLTTSVEYVDISPSVKRKRGKRPKDTKSYVQSNLTPYLSTGQERVIRKPGRPSLSPKFMKE